MGIKLKVHDDSSGLSIGGTEYKAKDGVVEVSEAHAAELMNSHGYKTVAQHQAAVEAEAKERRRVAAELAADEKASREARIAEAKQFLQSQGISSTK